MIRLVGHLMYLDEGEVLFYTTMPSYPGAGNRRPPTRHLELQGCLELSMTPEFQQYSTMRLQLGSRCERMSIRRNLGSRKGSEVARSFREAEV